MSLSFEHRSPYFPVSPYPLTLHLHANSRSLVTCIVSYLHHVVTNLVTPSNEQYIEDGARARTV
jgi:hypothetical protein